MIDRFEQWARQLVEGSFRRLFKAGLTQDEIANYLYRAMEDSRVGMMIADQYEVFLHPNDQQALDSDSLAHVLSGWVLRRAVQVGWTFAVSPLVVFDIDEHLQAGQVRVQAGYQVVDEVDAPSTAVYHSPHPSNIDPQLMAREAYVVLNGRQTIPLHKPLLTVGRRGNNDIVIDDPAVSRLHAHIRWQGGHFVLQDVSGRGRTRVNGIQVTQHVLQQGDVLRLGEASLVYAEDHPTRPNELDGQTQVFKRPDS